jgi:hypothetical protein
MKKKMYRTKITTKFSRFEKQQALARAMKVMRFAAGRSAEQLAEILGKPEDWVFEQFDLLAVNWAVLKYCRDERGPKPGMLGDVMLAVKGVTLEEPTHGSAGEDFTRVVEMCVEFHGLSQEVAKRYAQVHNAARAEINRNHSPQIV